MADSNELISAASRDVAVWFPFNTGDVFKETQGISTLAYGAYVKLLCFAWQKGLIPKSDALMRRVTGVDPGDWAEVKEEVIPLLTEGPDGYTIKWLEKERDRAVANREAARVRASKGGMAAKAKRDAHALSGASSASSSTAFGSASCGAPSPSPSPSPLPSPSSSTPMSEGQTAESGGLAKVVGYDVEEGIPGMPTRRAVTEDEAAKRNCSAAAALVRAQKIGERAAKLAITDAAKRLMEQGASSFAAQSAIWKVAEKWTCDHSVRSVTGVLVKRASNFINCPAKAAGCVGIPGIDV